MQHFTASRSINWVALWQWTRYPAMVSVAVTVALGTNDFHVVASLSLSGLMLLSMLFAGADCDEKSSEVNLRRFFRAGKFFIRLGFYVSLLSVLKLIGSS